MTEPWASAHVDVELDFDNLDIEMVNRLRRSAEIAQREVNKNFDKIVPLARSSFKRVGDSYEAQMRRIETRTKIAVVAVNKALAKINRQVDVDVKVNTAQAIAEVRNALTAMRAQAASAGLDVDIAVTVDDTQAVAALREAIRAMRTYAATQSISVPIDVDSAGAQAQLAATIAALRAQAAAANIDVNVDVNTDRDGGSKRLGKLGSMLGGLGKSALGALGGFAKLTAMAGGAVVALGGMMPVLAGVGAALGAAAGGAGVAAAAGLFAVAAAGAAVKTAFSGISDVTKNMFDPEKAEEFEKAIAKLTPNAQSAMRAFQGLGKQYADVVKKSVQDRMFQGLAPEISKLSQFMNPLKNSLTYVAAGFNDGANRALNFINTARGASMITTLLAHSSKMASNLGNGLTRLAPGFLSIGAAATKAISPLTDGIGDMAGKWSQSMLQMQQDGTLEQKFKSLIEVAKQVGQVLGQIGSIIGGVFRAASAAGEGNPMSNILGTLTQVSEWVNGPGQAALTSFFQSMGQAMAAIMPIVLSIAGIIGGQVAPMIAELITTIAPVVGEIVTQIGYGIAALQPAIAPLGQALSAIGTAIAPVMPIIGQLISQFVQLAGPIIGSLATALGPVLQALGQGLVAALGALTPLVGPITQLFGTLGPILAQIASVLGDVLTQAIQMMMPWWEALIGAVSQILQAVSPLIPVIGTLLTSVFSAISPVIQVLADVLGKVASALSDALGSAIQAIAPALESLAPVFAQIGEVMGQFAGMLGDVLVQAVEMLAPLLPQIVDAFMQLLTALMPLVPILLQLAMTCLQPIIGLLPSLIQIMTSVLPIIVQLASLFAVLVTAVMPLINILAKVIGFFVNLLGTIIGFGVKVIAVVVEFVAGIVAGFVGMVTKVVETVSGWVSSVLGFFGDLISSATQKAGEIWTNVKEAFSTGVTNTVNFVKELPGKIIGALAGAGKWLVDVGKNAIQGLIDGIKSMLSSIGNAIVSIFPSIIQGPVRSALGLALGGLVPALATGGLAGALGGGEITGATTTIKPGGFIVNAAQTRRNKGLLKRLAPRGRVLSGPGTGTSDSITGMFNGQATSRVSKGEFYAPPEAVSGMLPAFMAINAGRAFAGLPRFDAGGLTPHATQVRSTIMKNWPSITDIGGYRPPDGYNEHSSGNALDVMIPGWDTEKGKALGDEVLGWTMKNGDALGLSWALWRQRSHNPGDMQGQMMEDRGSPTQNHMDHLHIFMNNAPKEGATLTGPTLTAGTTPPSGGVGPTASSSTPIGSGITGSTPSWGNSGGGSKFNSASEAKRSGITPVWVENWPSSIGGSSGSSLSTGSTGDLSTGSAPTSTTGGPKKDLKKGASKQEMMDEVYRVGKEKGMSDEEILAAGETLLAESDGKNYANSNVAGSTDRPHDAVGSDHKSVGVMQQQVGMGWGELDQLMDPTYAIGRFYDEMKKNPGSGPAHQRAQAVQRSAFSDGSNYLAKESEAKALLANSKKNQVPVTPQGTVPVTVTPGSTTGDLSTGTTGDLGTTAPGAPTPGAPGTNRAAFESMRFGIPRANAWAGSQNFAGQAQQIGQDALREFGSELFDPIGLTSVFEKGFDHIAQVLTEAQKNGKPVQFADVVNFYGTDPAETKKATTDGMTAATETYRQG